MIPILTCPEESRQGCQSEFNNQADLIFHLVIDHKWTMTRAKAAAEQVPTSHDLQIAGFDD